MLKEVDEALALIQSPRTGKMPIYAAIVINDLLKRQQTTEQWLKRGHGGRSSSWSRPQGVYCIFSGSEVVYVGSSGHVLSRVKTHLRKNAGSPCAVPDIDLTAAAFVQCESRDMETLERTLIRALRPRFNKTHNADYKKI